MSLLSRTSVSKLTGPCQSGLSSHELLVGRAFVVNGIGGKPGGGFIGVVRGTVINPAGSLGSRISGFPLKAVSSEKKMNVTLISARLSVSSGCRASTAALILVN